MLLMVAPEPLPMSFSRRLFILSSIYWSASPAAVRWPGEPASRPLALRLLLPRRQGDS